MKMTAKITTSVSEASNIRRVSTFHTRVVLLERMKEVGDLSASGMMSVV